MALNRGWYPQDDGRERYWDGARWTDAFRPAEGEAAVGEPEAASQAAKKQGSGGIGCLAWAAVPVLIVLALSVKSCGGSSSSDESDKYAVQVTCQGLVKDNLKNPSTAEFSEELQSTASASGLVTAENALGGKQTFAYRCSASGDTVKLESLNER